MKKSLVLILIVTPFLALAQQVSSTYIDDQGVIRWSDSQKEVKGFGVNYTVPFAHAYRTAQKMEVDPKKAIDQDVYHFKRLGFDLYRIHVWDSEISDSLGNLIINEQLDHFDYLLKKLDDYNINYVITPIAFWGNGWPEPDTYSPGFSYKYGKDNCLTEPGCISAQEQYLTQFMQHTNPYTGIAYKDDPRLIAIEVSNEPHHRGEAKEVTDFVKRMRDAIRKSGTKKPIFYNGSHAVHFTEAYFEGGAQGGTFQWYPTGLGYQREIPGNLLPNVNNYHIPFNDKYKRQAAAKLVYEFDAADVGRTYIYPAMARSFREAGIQIATHFSYDPTFMAFANTEYNTHYMNLAYTPGKAISLMICGEVFREIPMYSKFGTYPDNNHFGLFTVDYLQDLALYNSDIKYFYTNSHNIAPKNSKKLQQIAGVGSSPMVLYEGKGAYFLDKLSNGLWRLEVMPDALWVDNPFGRNSLNKTVGVINWHAHKMRLNLDELQKGFNLQAINDGNESNIEVKDNAFYVSPGTYIIIANKTKTKWTKDDPFRNGKLKDFEAPQSNVKQAYLIHRPIKEVSASKDLIIKLKYIAPTKASAIRVLAPAALRGETIEMKETDAYHYEAVIPAEKTEEGILSYYIIVEDENGTTSYPAAQKGKPFDWDFSDRSAYETTVVPDHYPIHIFDAKKDTDQLVRQWRRGFRIMPTTVAGEYETQMYLEKLFIEDEENLNAEPVYDYTFKHFILDKVAGRKEDLHSMQQLVVKGRSLTDKRLKLQLALVMDDGSAFGAIMDIDPLLDEYVLDLDKLKPVKTVTLPRPYPSFLPYYFEHNNSSAFDIGRAESVQISIGPELDKQAQLAPHGLGLVHIRFE